MKAGKQWRTHLLPQLRPTSHHKPTSDEKREEPIKETPPAGRNN